MWGLTCVSARHTMIARSLSRLARMDRAEIAWRGTSAARILIDRARAAHRTGGMVARRSLPALTSQPRARHGSPRARRTAMGRCAAGTGAALRRGAAAVRRSHRHRRSALVERIRRDFPDATQEAAARADRIVNGEYDLLAYRGLRFDTTAESTQRPQRTQRAGLNLAWNWDPVNQRSAPMAFWATVPYLDPACGDHKVIWELNRHQHWIALGRAYWLTGDPRYRDRVAGGARRLARREPTARRRQLGEHARARVPVDLMDLGDPDVR